MSVVCYDVVGIASDLVFKCSIHTIFLSGFLWCTQIVYKPCMYTIISLDVNIMIVLLG